MKNRVSWILNRRSDSGFVIPRVFKNAIFPTAPHSIFVFPGVPSLCGVTGEVKKLLRLRLHINRTLSSALANHTSQRYTTVQYLRSALRSLCILFRLQLAEPLFFPPPSCVPLPSSSALSKLQPRTLPRPSHLLSPPRTPPAPLFFHGDGGSIFQ